MAITTLEKCSDPDARAGNEMRLVDYVRDPEDFPNPPADRITNMRQEEYEALPETPFFVGVPREVFESAKASERVRDVARGRVGLQTGDDKRFLAGIVKSFTGLPNTIDASRVAKTLSEDEQEHGISGSASFVPFSKGEGFGEYWREPAVAIDWSIESVAELERRAAWPANKARKTYFRNRSHFFNPGLNYSVVSSGRVSARLMPSGWAWSDKGSAIFTEDPTVSELFLLGYLNSSLATYFMKRIVNTTATAHVGYVEKLPFRRPSPELQAEVVGRVERIVEMLKADPDADVSPLRVEIDSLTFDLFEIGSSRQVVLDYYDAVGRVEAGADDEAADPKELLTDGQAAIE